MARNRVIFRNRLDQKIDVAKKSRKSRKHGERARCGNDKPWRAVLSTQEIIVGFDATRTDLFSDRLVPALRQTQREERKSVEGPVRLGKISGASLRSTTKDEVKHLEAGRGRDGRSCVNGVIRVCS